MYALRPLAEDVDTSLAYYSATTAARGHRPHCRAHARRRLRRRRRHRRLLRALTSPSAAIASCCSKHNASAGAPRAAAAGRRSIGVAVEQSRARAPDRCGRRAPRLGRLGGGARAAQAAHRAPSHRLRLGRRLDAPAIKQRQWRALQVGRRSCASATLRSTRLIEREELRSTLCRPSATSARSTTPTAATCTH